MRGSVEKLSSKTKGVRWRASLKYKDRGGKSHRPSKTFSSKADANAWLAVQVVSAGYGGTLAKGTVGVFLRDTHADRVKNKTIRTNTAKGYAHKIRSCIDTIGHVKLRDVQADDVNFWIGRMTEDGLSKSTIVQARNIVHKLFKIAVETKKLQFNPAHGAQIPSMKRPPKKKPDTRENAILFLRGMDETKYGVICRLMAMTGTRRSEAGALTWDNVDLERGTIHIEQMLEFGDPDETGNRWHFNEPKSATSNRTIPIPPVLVSLLRKHQTAQKEQRLKAGELWNGADNLVFCDEIGERLNLNDITKTAREKRIALGLPKATQPIHGLRHLFGTTQNAIKTEVKTISAMMGHSRASSTIDLYIEADQDQAQEAAAKMGDLFG